MDLIDSHCHLDVAEFDADRDEVIARARAAGISRQLLPAIAADGFAGLRDLCRRHGGLHAAYGLHPLFLPAHRPAHLDELADWIDRERPVAVGECGLDCYVEDLDRELQRRYFLRQLELARDFDLPLILHARRAVEEVIAALRRIGGLRGVVHSFSGSVDQARQLWKLGFCLGFGGPITYPRARRLRDIVASMPLEFLLLETDSPDQPLHGHQGRRNEPAQLTQVCACAAALRGVEPETIATATTANCERVFALAGSAQA
jgi:TatD DNase family protein